MTETLHWYAETTGGVRQGDAPVHPGCGALHLFTDMPAGTLKAVRAELPWKMEADERLFMNGYQTWTYSPELDRNGKLRGTDHIPGFLRKKYAFDRYGDDFRPKQKKAEPCPEGHSSTNSLVVELMRKTANSTSTATRAAIQLDTCIVRVSKNWFVVVGTCQK